MISLEINAAAVNEEINNFMNNIKEITKPSVVTQLSKAIFTITGEDFVAATDRYARANPKKMHHVYEWGKIGDPSGRLFVLKRSHILNGNLMINANFLPSKMPVPINPELLVPGPTNKVVTSKSIFADKANVMEEGHSINYTAKKILAFVGNSGIVFIRPGKQINILHPGGTGVRGAFAQFMSEWYMQNGYASIENSGFYEKISKDVSIALNKKNANINTVRKAVTDTIIGLGLDQEIIK